MVVSSSYRNKTHTCTMSMQPSSFHTNDSRLLESSSLIGLVSGSRSSARSAARLEPPHPYLASSYSPGSLPIGPGPHQTCVWILGTKRMNKTKKFKQGIWWVCQ